MSWAALEILPASAGGTGTASVSGAGAVTAKATQVTPAAGAGAGSVTAAGTVSAAAGPTFPGSGSNALGVKVELFLNSVWTDVTQFVMLRNPVQISGMGRADWTSTLQAATVTLTLKNDGRFTPKLAAGAYYPYITRNTQIRVSVNATSVTAVAYSGFRFYGEVSDVAARRGTWPAGTSVATSPRHGIWLAHVAARRPPSDPRTRGTTRSP